MGRRRPAWPRRTLRAVALLAAMRLGFPLSDFNFLFWFSVIIIKITSLEERLSFGVTAKYLAQPIQSIVLAPDLRM